MTLASRFILAAIAIVAASQTLSAQQGGGQEDADSLVRLISAQSAELMEIDTHKYRKVTGPARFLHNNAYLICDTALWNVDEHIIHAWGNVMLLQEETVLTSDKLDSWMRISRSSAEPWSN